MCIYIKLLVNWIWGGSILMVIGGLILLIDRCLCVVVGVVKCKMMVVLVE